MSKKLRQGEIIHYRVTGEEAVTRNDRRLGMNLAPPGNHYEPGPGTGNFAIVQHRVGSPLSAGDRVPLIVVKVSGDRVNGQAILDGNDSLWVEGVTEGDEPGQWAWRDKDAED